MKLIHVVLAVWMVSFCALGQTNILKLDAAGAYGPVTKQNIAVTGQNFNSATRLTTTAGTTHVYDAGYVVPVIPAVKKNDVLAGEIWLRRVQPVNGNAFVTFNFENHLAPNEKSISRTIALGSAEWSRYRLSFRVISNYVAAGSQVTLFLGFPPQGLEVGPLALTNFGPNVTVSQFPNDLTYAGRNLDAPWRVAAAARIEQFRKANLALNLVDEAGFPVTNGTVQVRLTRHQFGFGSAVDGPMLLGRRQGTTSSDLNRYRSTITNWFNKAVLENDLKWYVWEQTLNLPSQPFGPGTATNALKWLGDRGIPVRGHNLIWPSTNEVYFLPNDVPGLFGDTNRLRTRINSHFTNILTQTKDKCVEWDVINEPYYNHTIMDKLGYGEMIEWFKLAHVLDPKAKLYLNEYGNLEVAGLKSTQTDDFFNKSKYLLDGGAPLEGLGMQSHFGDYLPDPVDLLAMLDRFATLGLPIQSTEFDINVLDEQTQADYLRDFMTVMFSHPSVNAVVMWGFWAGQHWLPDAALFKKDWTLKPNGIMWSNLVFKEWSTTADLTPDGEGHLELRGFKGEYEITSRSGGATNISKLSLDSSTNVLVALKIPAPSLSAAARADGKIDFRWNISVSGYRIESSPTLKPAQWSEVPGAADEPQGGWFLTVNPPLSGAMFYRLSRTTLP